jgi:hypothetical protein
MKNISLILSAFAVLFTACETDFDVNAKWEETTVVYGLLDASTDTQYVRINKAFLGEMDALQMAQYADSINFGIDDLDVKIYKWDYNQLIDSVALDAVYTIRDGYIFNDTIVVYEFINENSFLKNGFEYELVVINLITGNRVSSRTELVESFSFGGMDDKFSFYKPFNPDTIKFTFENVKWTKAENATIYQLVVRINYTENNDTLYLDWVQPLEDEDATILEGKKFFSFLEANSIEGKQLEVTNPDLIRRFQKVDLFLTAGTSDLHNYIQVNEPITGIAQQRPEFTNINNGIGLFTSRYSLEKIGVLELSDETKDYIRENLNLNFQ